MAWTTLIMTGLFSLFSHFHPKLIPTLTPTPPQILIPPLCHISSLFPGFKAPLTSKKKGRWEEGRKRQEKKKRQNLQYSIAGVCQLDEESICTRTPFHPPPPPPYIITAHFFLLLPYIMCGGYSIQLMFLRLRFLFFLVFLVCNSAYNGRLYNLH